MDKYEMLYDCALSKQRMVEQRKILASAINANKTELALIETKTYHILLRRYKEAKLAVKKALPNVRVA